jgi:hypothetical protein
MGRNRSIYRSAFAALVAVFAMSLVIAAGAQAEGGPVWVTHNGVMPKKIVSAGSIGLAGFEVVSTGNVQIECLKEAYTGEITGTNPGTGTGTFTFTECTLRGSGYIQCAATGVGQHAGVIALAVKAVLMYPKAGLSSTEAEEAFFPTGTENIFAEVTLRATGYGGCGVLEGKTFLVKATGTEVKEPAVDKKCGFLAQVGRDNGGSFARTASAALFEAGALNFTRPAEEPTGSAVVWQEKAKTFKKVTCSMQSGLSETGRMSGTAMVSTEPAESYGWEI